MITNLLKALSILVQSTLKVKGIGLYLLKVGLSKNSETYIKSVIPLGGREEVVTGREHRMRDLRDMEDTLYLD